MSVLLAALLVTSGAVGAEETDWTENFQMEGCAWASSGSNPFFSLEPGHQLVLAGADEGKMIDLTITVLDEVETVGAVETRVIEERELKDGELYEVSRNFFAICQQNNGVFYFGEDVDFYEDGEIVDHEGEWRAGVDEARAGLIMPGLPLIGARYYQEVAPDVAMDRAEVLSVTETVETPAGTFQACLKTEETTPIEPDVTEHKLYAPGIGLIQDGDVQLVRWVAAVD